MSKDNEKDKKDSLFKIMEEAVIKSRTVLITGGIDDESARKAVVSLLALSEMSDDPINCLLYTSPSPRDKRQSRMPSSA